MMSSAKMIKTISMYFAAGIFSFITSIYCATQVTGPSTIVALLMVAAVSAWMFYIFMHELLVFIDTRNKDG